MLSELRSYRKKLEADRKAKELAAKSRRKRKPRLARHDFERRSSKWHTYNCSECERQLHRTARFCVECGAWFV